MSARRKAPSFTLAEAKRMVASARACGFERPVPVFRKLPDGSCELTARDERGDAPKSDVSDWDKALGLD